MQLPSMSTAVGANHSAAATQPRFRYQALAAIASGLLLALPHMSAAFYLFTWISFVPLLWATSQSSAKQAYLLGLIAGIALYVTATSWVDDFIQNYKGYDFVLTAIWSLMFWLYSAQLPALLMLCVRWLQIHSGLSTLLIFPCVATLFFGKFPMLFSAQLAETQSNFTVALQATEFVGAYGLDVVIALVNVLVASAFIHARQTSAAFSKPLLAAHCAVLMLVIAWFGFGFVAVKSWQQQQHTWPVAQLGLVQPNEPPSVSVPDPTPGFSKAYPPELAISELLAASQPALLLWPETRFKGFFQNSYIEQSFSAHAKRLQVPLAFQDIESEDNTQRQFNSAVLIDATGTIAGTHRKIKRVAFGEYLPIVDYFPSLKALLKRWLGDFYADFSQGDGPVQLQSGSLNFLPLICYEVMFPDFVAEAVQAHPQAHFLLGMSNNGWFGETFQPYQHINSSLLRAVETRLPLVHLTNNGPTLVVAPSGERLLQTAYHEGGGLLIALPYPNNPKPTFFVRFPNLVLGSGTGLVACIFFFGVWRRFHTEKLPR